MNGAKQPQTRARRIAGVPAQLSSGELDPAHVHTPDVFVQRVVRVSTAEEKIE